VFGPPGMLETLVQSDCMGCLWVRIRTGLKFLLVVPGPVGLAVVAVALLVIAVEAVRLLLG